MTESIQHQVLTELTPDGGHQLSIDLPSLAPAALQNHTEVVLAVLWDPRIPPLGKRVLFEALELMATDRVCHLAVEDLSTAGLSSLDTPIPIALAEPSAQQQALISLEWGRTVTWSRSGYPDRTVETSVVAHIDHRAHLTSNPFERFVYTRRLDGQGDSYDGGIILGAAVSRGSQLIHRIIDTGGVIVFDDGTQPIPFALAEVTR